VIQFRQLLLFPFIEFFQGIKNGSVVFIKRVFVPRGIAARCKHGCQHYAIRDKHGVGNACNCTGYVPAEPHCFEQQKHFFEKSGFIIHVCMLNNEWVH
jgi:hypothetical protein